MVVEEKPHAAADRLVVRLQRQQAPVGVALPLGDRHQRPPVDVGPGGGGLGDIGRAVADELARLGADVSLGDVAPPATAEAAVAALTGLGGRAAYRPVDVPDAAAVEAWVDDVERSLGVPTLVIANPAQVTQADFRSLTAEQWARELRVNLDGAFHLAHAAGRRMIARGKPTRTAVSVARPWPAS